MSDDNSNNNNTVPSGVDMTIPNKYNTETKERAIKEVPAPVWTFIPRDKLYAKDGLPNIDNLKKHLLKEGRVSPKDAIELIQRAATILRNEPNLLQLQDPITGK